MEFQGGGASLKRAAAILEHVESCEGCRAAAAEYEQLGEVLGSFRSDEEPLGGWEAFEGRMLKTARTPQGGGGALGRRLAMAASVVIVGGLAYAAGRFTTRPHDVARPVESVSTSAPAFAPQQITHEVGAFARVAEVLDGHASWMVVSKDDSDVGVATEPVSAGSPDVLLLRLTLTREGKVESDVDLLVIPGQTAKLTFPLKSDQSLRYTVGTTTDNPTRLSLWLELHTPSGDAPLAALATKLTMQPGEKTSAGQLSTVAGDYELTLAFARSALPGKRP